MLKKVIMNMVFLSVFVFSKSYCAPTDFPDAGARAAGMGNAYVAVASDPTATYWNPAGLTQIKQPQITLMNSSKTVMDVRNELLAVVYPLGNNSSFGINYYSLGVENIPGYDEFGDFTSFFEYKMPTYIFSYGRELNGKLSIGGSIKHFKEKTSFDDPSNPAFRDTVSAKGWGFDVGLLYNLDIDKLFSYGMSKEYVEKITVGLLVQNISTKMKWSTGKKETHSTNYKIGTVSYGMDGKLLVAMDWDKTTNFHIGAEYWLIDRLGIRLGSDDGKFTAGVSFKLLNYQIDYAYVESKKEQKDIMGDIQKVSITYSF